jgi:hypothetical protein
MNLTDLSAGLELFTVKTGPVGVAILALYLSALTWLMVSIGRGTVGLVQKARRGRQSARALRDVEMAAYREYQPKGQVVQLQSRAQRRRAEAEERQ